MAAIQEELKRLREVATDLLARRQQGAKADDKAIKELSASGLLSLLRLRSANKGVALGTEELREETSKAKLSLEQADLALQVMRDWRIVACGGLLPQTGCLGQLMHCGIVQHLL